MFGCLAAGRMVQTNLQQIDATKYVFVLPDAKNINHIVVFLTGAQLFPTDYGATVHFGWPGPDGTIGWQYLGYLSNDKPSAVFKVTAYKAAIALEESTMVDGTISAHIGISIEPLATVEATAAAASAANAQSLVKRTPLTVVTVDPVTVARRVAEHFYNYMTSFLNGPGNEALLQLMKQWLESVQQKLRMDPDFWKRETVAA